jgi:hypothetical protein
MSKNLYQRWFVTDYYICAGRPIMEDQLMQYAQKEWLYCSVYETFIPSMVKDLKERQDVLREANKRLKKVDIYFHPIREDDDLVFLYIGQQHLTLRKIREEIEYQK